MPLVHAGHPFDCIKVLMQTQPSGRPVYSGVVDCVVKTVRSDGVRGGLYRGAASPLIGQVYFQAIKFAAYGQSVALVRHYYSTSADHHMGLREFFIAGALAQVRSTPSGSIPRLR